MIEPNRVEDNSKDNIDCEKSVSMKYHSLRACNDANIDAYEEILDEVLYNQGEFMNIAISGLYGAGKSSLIETYKKKKSIDNSKKKLKFLHLSLTNFNVKDKSKSENNNIIEWRLMNQLIYQIDPNNIPLTSIKSKRNKRSFFLKIT
ncbi:MAG: hypothetical protein RSA66_08020, partial [Muribaculaceae bacterium]